MKRLLELLYIAYQYNDHSNCENRIYISIVGDKDAVIIYKQRVQGHYEIKALKTELTKSEVVTTITDFFSHIPTYPEVIYNCFTDIIELMNYYSPDVLNVKYII